MTALHHAVRQRYGSDLVAALFLQVGAPVDALDNDNMTPLFTLPFFGCGTNALILLHHGASVHIRNKNGQTPLHFASRYNPSSVSLLIQAGADVNVQDNHGATPLHFALASTSQDIFIDGGHEYAEEELLESNLKAIELLLGHGSNVNLRNVHDKTPLQVALVGVRQQVEQLFLHCNQS
jgi:ankyrin repeat protein